MGKFVAGKGKRYEGWYGKKEGFCTYCDGSGRTGSFGPYGKWEPSGTCRHCHGTGKSK